MFLTEVLKCMSYEMYYQEEEEDDSRSSRLTGQFTPVYFTHYLTKVYTLPKEK